MPRVIDNNLLAQILQGANGDQPMNTIRASSGEYLTPAGRSASPYQFQSALSAPQYQGSPVDVFGQGRGYMQPDGTIVGTNAAGQTFRVQPSGTAEAQQAVQDAAMKRDMMKAQIENLQAEAKMKQAESMGGAKPIFNADAGGFVYPPSPDAPQGKFVPVSGYQKPDKPLTEYQGKSVMFGTRAAEAHNQLLPLEDQIYVSGLQSAQATEGFPFLGAAAHAMLSPEQQKVDQAQRNFVNATMRQESGMTISPSEFENARKQYFPQVGDSKEVIEQKRKNREMVIQGFSRVAGPGSKDIEEIRQQSQFLPQSGVPKTGEVRSGYMFLGGDPADPNRWKQQ